MVTHIRIAGALSTVACAALLLCTERAAAVPSSTAPRMLASERADAYVYPVMGPRLSSSYGKRRHPVKKVTQHHHGIDLAAPAGAPIRAIADGQVMFADPYAGYGKLVVLQHSNGLTSHYGHCAKLSVQPGAHVRAGDIIGTVGSTGISTGPHLHFELRKDGSTLNPEKLLPGLADGSEG
jgi:murein DD-endopeptidase MepM/ murein hydrolase activator NlpD